MQVEQALKEKITTDLEPRLLKIINESPNHSHYKGAESHFKIIVVSEKFEGLTLVRRHQLVYTCIKDLLKNQIHACSQHTLTPDEWVSKGGELPSSPPCSHKK